MDSDSDASSNVGRVRIKDFARISQSNTPSTNKKRTNTAKKVTPSTSKSTAKTKNDPNDEEIRTTPAKRSRRTNTATTTPSTVALKRSTVKKSTKVKDLTEAPANNKLISQFFKPISETPKVEKAVSLVKKEVGNEKENESHQKILELTSTSALSEKENKTNQKPSQTAEKSTPMVTIPKARRRICPGTDLKLVSNRYHDEDQTRMSEFFDKTKTFDFNYYTTSEKSKLPVIIDGELDVESCLGICLTEESRIIDFNETQEDEKSVEQKQAEIIKLIDRIENPVRDAADDERDAWNMENQVEAVTEINTTPRQTQKEPKIRSTVICPKYKIIAGTTFAVDAFRFGYIEGISHYFLTHFHSDHYIGLKKTFNRPLIMSRITAACVTKFVGVDSQNFILLDPNEETSINGIKITALDANHCPGAVMFAFTFPEDNEITLHVGDFRATPEMESLPIFWNHPVKELYLDTTYLTSKYSLCTQEDCIKLAIDETEAYFKKNIFEKVLVIVGAYVVGKEKVWTALAEQFNLRVWADKNRRDALDAINNPQMTKYLVSNPKDAQLHVINMGFVNYDDLKNYLEQFENTFTHILAFRPSGWEKKKKPRHQGKISIVGLEYSEHSSYDELRRFVGFLRPKTIISTVPTGRDPNKTPTIPEDWYQGDLKPHRVELQPKIYDIIAKDSSSSRSSTPSLLNKSSQLNPSAIKRRQETNKKTSALKITQTIELDSD